MKNREKEAADAYLNFLQSKGATSGSLYLRSRFLDALNQELKSKKQSRNSYAEALKETRHQLSKEDQKGAVDTAREYYAFWVSDVKAIANFEKRHGYNIKSEPWEAKPKTLKALKGAVETNIFTNDETLALENYTDKLLRTISDIPTVNERVKYAKTLIVRLRDAPEKNHTFYRKAIDLTLNLFKNKDEQKLYLDVAREFYKFWRSNPGTYAN